MTAHLADTPVLETERLTLRAPTMADYPVWEAFAATDRARFIGGPYTKRDAWRAFGHFAGMWALKGVGSFVFERREDGAALGATGPWVPEDWPEPEIGWTVWRDEAEGKGYAYEAATAARDFAFDTLGWDTVVSYIDHGNDRSVALARRLGAVEDADAEQPIPGKTMHIYRHRKEARA